MKQTCGTCYGYNPKSVCELCRHKDGAACAEWRPKQTCGNCVCYLTDEDDKGNVTEFRHDRNKESGFCATRDLFFTVKKDEKACPLYTYDKED